MADSDRGGPPPQKERAPRATRRAIKKTADEAAPMIPHPAPVGEPYPMLIGALLARLEQLEALAREHDRLILLVIAALLARGDR